MSYIGDTHWKKFKKLLLISKAIIKNHGFNYFFYVIKLEIEKQGLNIFHPDAKPIEAQSNKLFQKQYTKFLESYHNEFNKKLSSLTYLSHQPIIKIIIMFDKKNKFKLNDTLISLQNQTYKNWNILLVEKTHNDDNLNLEIAHHSNFIYSKSFGDANIFHKEILSDNSEFVGFLNPGDVLDSSALHEFIHKINQNNLIDILYSDNDILKNNLRKNPFFKPNWSPYLQHSMNYLSSLCLIKKVLLKNIHMNSIISDCLEYDIILKSIEQSEKILHIPLPLCSIIRQTLSKNQLDCKKRSLIEYLKRRKILADVKKGILKNTFRINNYY